MQVIVLNLFLIDDLIQGIYFINQIVDLIF